MSQAIAALGYDGTAVLVRIAAGQSVAFDPMSLENRGLTVKGSIMAGDAVPALFVIELIGFWRQGLLPVEKMIRHYAFAAVPARGLAMEGRGRIVADQGLRLPRSTASTSTSRDQPRLTVVPRRPVRQVDRAGGRRCRTAAREVGAGNRACLSMRPDGPPRGAVKRSLSAAPGHLAWFLAVDEPAGFAGSSAADEAPGVADDVPCVALSEPPWPRFLSRLPRQSLNSSEKRW